MFFTDGDHMAFEILIRDRPGDDHYDSGAPRRFPEYWSCRYHRPRRKGKKGHDCKYAECPYLSDRVTATAEGNPQQGAPTLNTVLNPCNASKIVLQCAWLSE